MGGWGVGGGGKRGKRGKRGRDWGRRYSGFEDLRRWDGGLGDKRDIVKVEVGAL
jgi:hypothetical protein